MSDGTNIARNCDGKSNPSFRHVTAHGLAVFTMCPKSWIANEATEAAQAVSDYTMFKRFKTLPNAGGMLDQDARFFESIEIIDSEVAIVHRVVKEARNGA